MKPQTFESTPIAAKGRSHASVTPLAGLLVLAAILIGGGVLFSQRPPAAASDTRSTAAHTLIANCRACRDEALAERQGLTAASERSARPGVVGTAAHTLIANCRACRDEALAARQGFASASSHVAQPVVVSVGARALIANCRACRDEALGSAVTDLSATDSSLTLPAPAKLFWRNGPR
jgi:hypothetical protein